jgi:hypothetical protein
MCPMSTQWERLNSELSKKHKSWSSLADYLGLQKQNVGNWKSRGIPAKYLRKSAEFVSRTHDWLDIGDESDQSIPAAPDHKQNQPLAGESIASGAININVNRQAPQSAHDVATALVGLMARVEPGHRDAVASLLSSLARNPADPLLTEMLVKILDPATFTQPEQRTG